MSPKRSTRPARFIALLVAFACLAGGCAVTATSTTAPAGSNRVPVARPGDEEVEESPDQEVLDLVELPIEGSDGSHLNLIASSAAADLEAWWAEQYPQYYGSDYLPLAGGLHAYDSASRVRDLPCDMGSIEDVLDNAYYCPDDDAIAWDQENLMPELAASYGEFTVAVVIAHEWGHVIQDGRRARIFESPLTLELQADCFAGAWVAHVRTADQTFFEVDDRALDQAVAGILSLRDIPGASADDPGAHGSGFDRVGAFQDGYEDGLDACYDYSDATLAPFLLEFTSLDDYYADGNLPLEDGAYRKGIMSAAEESLGLWWADVFPEISSGREWSALELEGFAVGEPPTCDGVAQGGSRLIWCGSEDLVAYEARAMEVAYDTDGDFAVATLLATQYGVAAQDRIGFDVAEDPATATLRGNCYAGAWGAALLGDDVGATGDRYGLVLSPGDLDEGVAVLLTFRTDLDRSRQGKGFDRVRAFRIGVTQGADACGEVVALGS